MTSTDQALEDRWKFTPYGDNAYEKLADVRHWIDTQRSVGLANAKSAEAYATKIIARGMILNSALPLITLASGAALVGAFAGTLIVIGGIILLLIGVLALLITVSDSRAAPKQLARARDRRTQMVEHIEDLLSIENDLQEEVNRIEYLVLIQEEENGDVVAAKTAFYAWLDEVHPGATVIDQLAQVMRAHEADRGSDS